MKKLVEIASIAALPLAIISCSGEKEAPEADNVTETQMDEVDVIDGTISDDMVDVDTQQTGDEIAEDGEETVESEGDSEEE